LSQDRIREVVKTHFAGTQNHADVIFTLITIERFLSS
jgi:hypothetical protein